MRAASLKYAILSTTAVLVMLIVLAMPFHAFLTIWGASLIGHYTALRLWKECLLVICMLGVLYLLATDHKIRSHTLTRRLVWLTLIYGGLTIAWGLVALGRHTVSAKALGYGLIVDLRFLAFFLVTWAITLRTSRLRVHWQQLVLWPAVIVAGFGLLQAFVLPHNFLSHFGYGPNTIAAYETINHNVHYIRIASTLRGANPLGAYLLIPISLLTVLIVHGKRRWQYIVLLLAMLVTLYLSFSRSAWLGAVLSAGVIVAVSIRSGQTKRWLLGLAGVGLLIIIGLTLNLRHNDRFQNIVLHTQSQSAVKTTSDQGHTAALKAGLQDLRRQPLGQGPGTAGPASLYNTSHPERIAENFYIQIGQETGWLGLVLFVLINGGVGYLLWLRRADPFALGLLASLIGISFINLLSHAWADDTLAYVWWGLAGIAMAPFTKVTSKQR